MFAIIVVFPRRLDGKFYRVFDTVNRGCMAAQLNSPIQRTRDEAYSEADHSMVES
jgi:hypothetical protein